MCGDTEGWHLAAFREFLRAMGDPQKGLPVIHVAGTKGKGSTTRMLASLLAASGWKRVGTFTSPHLETFRERICVDGKMISKKDFVAAADKARLFFPEGPREGFRTTFEVLTAMALWHFHARKCEAVVLETGLGGRLDCTNVVDSRVAVITTIGYDHQKVLGSTLRKIAGEKAGIITRGTQSAIVAPQMPRRRSIVASAARQQGKAAGVPIRVYENKNDPIASVTPHSWGYDLTIRIAGLEADGLQFHALGRHQLNNLRGALMALEAFARIEGRSIRAAGLRRGIERITLPGRMELASDDPTVIVDGAHCAASARAAAQGVAEQFPGRNLILVVGVLGDKNHRQLLAELTAGPPVRFLLTHTPPTPRGFPAQRLASLARRNAARVRACDSLQEAIERALEHQRRHPRCVILVTGSTYSIGPARDTLRSLLHS